MEAQISSTICGFLERLGYSKPAITIDVERRSKLKEALLDDFDFFRSHPHPSEWFDKISRVAIDLAQMPYSYHNFDVQLYVARYTLFTLFFDDFVTAQMPESLGAFQRKLITNEEDSDIMIAYRRILADTYRIWDDIPANSMVNSILEFMTGCALEGNDSIKSMKVHRTATTWPDFLRAKTGISPLYAFMVFPLQSPLDSYIQVMGDANSFLELTNDVLSFYKEYLAGETQNYISNRAFVTGRSQVQTLQDVADRVVDAHNRICQTLEGSELMTWKVFVGGYLTFHVTSDRYFLKEILPEVLCDLGDLGSKMRLS